MLLARYALVHVPKGKYATRAKRKRPGTLRHPAIVHLSGASEDQTSLPGRWMPSGSSSVGLISWTYFTFFSFHSPV